jgi:hypothetical protein
LVKVRFYSVRSASLKNQKLEKIVHPMSKISLTTVVIIPRRDLLMCGLLCIVVLLGFPKSARATLLFQDSNNYADDAALRAVYKSSTDLTTDTEFTFTASGLSFANHFASSGGAQRNATNERSIASMDTTLQMTGAYTENEWNGQSFAFYSSFLLSASSIPVWGVGRNGASILTSKSGVDGFGLGIGPTNPDSDDFTTSLVAGNRGNSFQGTTTIQVATTYLILARFDYTNMDEATYNPWSSNGSLRARYELFTEADGYPISEGGITWEIDETVSNTPRGENVFLAFAGFSAGTNGEGNYTFDELRVGTEFDEVIQVIPEPNTALLILVSLGVLALFRRRG